MTTTVMVRALHWICGIGPARQSTILAGVIRKLGVVAGTPTPFLDLARPLLHATT
jgi:hypothetical protein